MIWRCGPYRFDLSRRVLVMGIVNVTPDSFSDGGRFLDPDAAAAHALRLIEEGADLLDLGGESTRPGAQPVGADEEWRRLGPVFERLGRQPGVCLSVDTSQSAVAERALQSGASVINDITALRGDPRMVEMAARSGAGVVLMHMRGTPASMQQGPRYDDVVREVREFLAERLAFARANGVSEDRLATDPGIGFGKTAEHNWELLARLGELDALGRPLLVGVSRKSFIGKLLDLPVDDRLEGSLAAATAAVLAGARIVRAHDVRATVRAVRVAEAVRAGARERQADPAMERA
jgi:dihydropteroate synthase